MTILSDFFPNPTLTILDRAIQSGPLLGSLADPTGDPPPFVSGNIITATGTQISPVVPVELPLDAEGRLATEAGGVRILLDGIPAPILAASQDRIVFRSH